ncbi:MAG: AI-2E family transporter [Proteobacteria bacterium]|nr:AI-2E family transporter [Pseudomonadota bacterium]NOG61536.1 AI-2E family transporter [Pseudomonadota bacterium]
MFEFISRWYRRYFTDPQASLLVVLLVVSVAILMTMGKMLAPLFAALVIAYLLEGAVFKLEKKKMPRNGAVYLVYILFVAFMMFILLILLPRLSRQVSQFFKEVPDMISNGQALLLRLPEQYPEMISVEYVEELIYTIQGGLSDLGQNVLSISVASIPAIITILVYLVLVPLMIFFFLKDKGIILEWMGRFLPKERQLVNEIWIEMDGQIGNYVRGKSNEILIVGSVAYIVFVIFGLNYASLLAMLVGLSVLIPYIGAAVVTLPIAFVAYFQWGLETDFIWLLVCYGVIQFLDGNVLVPILFSEAVNLHPVAIIVAILVFGGLWGFWGVFFAIPLATLVKALINVWPTHEGDDVTLQGKVR